MRVAYIVSAYRNPGHLARLVRRLHTGSNSLFLVHVDAKTSETTYRAMTDGLAGLSGVRFLPRHACHWGGFGHVRASLKGLNEIARIGADPEHVILLSGQDYPIKSNQFIERFLDRGSGKSFFLHFPLPTENWSHGGLNRFRDWHLRTRGFHVRVPLRRRIPLDLRPWGGSAYWIVSRNALATITAFVAAHPEYVRFFRHVDIPDELFFQTILLNGPEAPNCVNFRLHYTEWDRIPAPAVLTRDDYEAIAESPCLFARKFDDSVDGEILALIDERLLS
jgi:hypothetical protein